MVNEFVLVLTYRYWPEGRGSLTGTPLFLFAIGHFAVQISIAILLAWISRVTFEEFFLRRKPRQPKVVENLSAA